MVTFLDEKERATPVFNWPFTKIANSLEASVIRETLKNIIMHFQVTGQIPCAATQAADDGQLVAQVSSLAVALGNAWE